MLLFFSLIANFKFHRNFQFFFLIRPMSWVKDCIFHYRHYQKTKIITCHYSLSWYHHHISYQNERMSSKSLAWSLIFFPNRLLSNVSWCETSFEKVLILPPVALFTTSIYLCITYRNWTKFFVIFHKVTPCNNFFDFVSFLQFFKRKKGHKSEI